MDTTSLGRTGLMTSRLGFGMWPIGGTKELGDYGTVDDREAVAAIRRGLDLGVTLFDTAPAYGEGRAEEILGQALGDQRDDVIVVTKCAVHWDWDASKWVTDSTRAEILRSAEESLRRLRRDLIDVLLIHVPDPAVTPEEPMAGVRGAQVRRDDPFLAASRTSPRTVPGDTERSASVDVIQVGYHLFDRRMQKAMLPLAHEAGDRCHDYGSLAHGLSDRSLGSGPRVRCQGLARRR